MTALRSPPLPCAVAAALASLLLAACPRAPEPPARAPASEQAPPSARVPPPVDEAAPAADAGARPGVPEAAAERTYVYACAGGLRVVARVGPDGAWLFLPKQTVKLPPAPPGEGTRFSDGRTTLSVQGEEAVLGRTGQPDVSCRNQPALAVWEDAKLRGVDFRATGNEPGWFLELDDGAQLLFVTAYGGERHVLPMPAPQAAPGRTVYVTQGEGRRLEVVLEGRPCKDTMSGEAFSTSVTVTLDGKTFRGCGRPLH